MTKRQIISLSFLERPIFSLSFFPPLRICHSLDFSLSPLMSPKTQGMTLLYNKSGCSGSQSSWKNYRNWKCWKICRSCKNIVVVLRTENFAKSKQTELLDHEFWGINFYGFVRKKWKQKYSWGSNYWFQWLIFFLSLEFVVSKEKYWFFSFFTSKLFKNSKIRSIFSATDYVDWISKNARKEIRFFEDFCDIIDIRVF